MKDVKKINFKKIKTHENVIVSDYVFEHETEEFYKSDLVKEALPNKRINDDTVYENYEFLDKENDLELDYTEEVDPIKIDLLKKLIERAEKAGASHMKFHYHTDHRSYNVYGL